MGNPSLEAWIQGAWNLDSNAVTLLLVTMCAFLVPIVIILPPVPLQKSDALLQTHTLAGLAPNKSNLKKAPSRPEAHEPADASQPVKVQALMVYPVQSCQGVELSRARVGPRGFEHDGIFTFAQVNSTFPVPVDATAAEKDRMHSWAAITARQFPVLESADLVVELWLPDEMKLRRQSIRSSEAFLILRFPWKERGWRGLAATGAAKLARGWRAVAEKEILLPVDLPGKEDMADRGYEYEDLAVGGDVTVSALNLSKELPDELRLFLGVSNKLGLFRIDAEKPRRGAGSQLKVGGSLCSPIFGLARTLLEHRQMIYPSADQFAISAPPAHP